MEAYTREELAEALKAICSTITNCEKMQPKFAEGTAQYSLLKNRIMAMYISSSLVTGEDITDKYTKEQLLEALPPVVSIIHKCEKAQLKFEEGTGHHTRLKKIIKAMHISKALIEAEINKRG